MKPFRDHVTRPDKESGNGPNDGHANKDSLIEKKSQGQHEVADVAHPKQVAQLFNAPVMQRLDQKENQRQDPQKTEPHSRLVAKQESTPRANVSRKNSALAAVPSETFAQTTGSF